MSGAILDLLSNPARWARISAGAAARDERFSEVEMTRRFAGLLDELRRSG